MLKLIDTSSFNFHGEPSVRIIDQSNSKELIKAAADSRISEYISKLEPEANKVYLHILAMGAGEFYGANRNADYFPENNLIDFHKTFETSPAHVFRNHVNKNPEIAIGQVVFSVYNERMHRVELIAWVDKEKGRDVVERIERGDFPATSMACKTPYDVCAVCGNKASTRQEYCEHLSEQLGRIYPDGKKAMALNVAPLRFFDISIVVRPADVTSSVLQKVASENGQVLSSAEAAEIEGLTEKAAAHKKLSEFIKEIEGGHVVDFSENLDSILAKVRDPEYGIIPHLAKHELAEVLSTMAHLGITPSLGFLAELIGHKIAGKDAEGIGDLVEGYVGSEGVSGMIGSDKSFDQAEINPFVVDLLMPSVKSASLLPEMVAERAYGTPVDHPKGMFIPGTNVGYIGNGPHVEETPVERFRRLYGDPAAHKPGGLMEMIKTLIVVGGAALAAKWYITNTIEKKMQDASAKQNNGVKIVLVKSASDYKSTYRLAKSAMAKVLVKGA